MLIIMFVFLGLIIGGIWSQSAMAGKLSWPDWLNRLFWND